MTDVSLVVAFGTDMGNAEDAAMTFAEGVADIGIDVSARELNQVDLAELRDATHFVVVCSTFGEGEFPDNALLFWEALSAADAGRLDHLSFAVLALGDTSYESFCNAGKLLDTRLEELGATRLTDRVDVDGFYEQPAAAWTTDVVKLLQAELGTAQPPAVATTARPDRDRGPVAARLAVNRRLNHPDSDKEVRHYEIDLAATGITYRAGDSLAVHATNDPVLVAALLQRFGVGPDHRVADHDAPLGVLLAERWEIRTPSRALQALVAARTTNADAAAGLATGDALTPGAYAYGRDVLDLLALADLDLDEVVDTMRPLQSRDYSIASSPLVHPDRVHLTVATVRYARASAATAAWRRRSSPIAANGCGCSCGPTTPFGSPRRTCRSSWSAPAPGSPRSAPSCRSAARPRRPGRRGCSSATAGARPTTCTATTSTASWPTAR